MEDVELVLRFFALKNGRYKSLRKGFREFLTSSLVEFNKLSASEIAQRGEEFQAYMTFLHESVGPYAFAKWRIADNKEKRMSTFNAAVYDAVVVGLSEAFSAVILYEEPHRVSLALNGYKCLFSDDDFFASVSGSVNDAAKVIKRIDAMVGYLRR